MECFYILDH